MEKHPIDSRFKTQLGDFRPQPSADAWARLQSRMAEAETEEIATEEPQKKRFVMWYSIAAAITLLLISVGVYRNSLNPELTNTVAVNAPIEKQSKAVVIENKAATEQDIVADKNTAVAVKTSKETTNLNSTAENQKTEIIKKPASDKAQLAQVNQPVKYNAAGNSKKVKSVKTEISETLPVVQQAEEKEMLASAELVKTVPETEKMLAKVNPENALEITVIRTEPEIVLASNATPEKDAISKTALVKNIFKQARNLKNGEKVDFQEIGIDPNSRLAVETKYIKQNIASKFTKVLAL